MNMKSVQKLVIEITGDSVSDLEQALDEVKRMVGEEYTSGHNSNETGSYNFDITNLQFAAEGG